MTAAETLAVRARRLVIGARLLLVWGAALLPVTAVQAEPYLPGPGDSLSIQVYGDPGLSGDFPVDADGAIGHPLLGSVAVAGKSLAQLRQELLDGLAPYLPNPAVAVRIASYAPVYALGEVEKPGVYAFRPGMTALQLVALAGGFRRADDTEPGGSRVRTIALEGDYTELALRRYALQAEAARLEAELAQTDYAFDTVTPAGVQPAAARRIVEAESRLFELRRDGLRSSEAGIISQIDGFAQEVASLTESVKLYDEETRLLAEDVDATRTLVERSIATPIRLREVLRAQSATRRDALDTRASLARAKQGALEAERSRAALRENFRTTAATTLREVELELAAARTRLDTMLSTLTEVGDAGGKSLIGMRDVSTELVIVRDSDRASEEILAEERTVLRPGDILRVENGPDRVVAAPSQ